MAIMNNGLAAASLPEELIQILISLASSWEDVEDPKKIQVTHLSGAMTNEVLRITWPTLKVSTSRDVLVRVYGQGVEIFFDRNDEIRTFEFISRHGLGPRLLGHFSGGRVEEFIRARTLSADDLRDPEISTLIAGKMREFHKLDMPGPKVGCLWNRMRDWLRKAQTICTAADAKAFWLDCLESEIQMLEEKLSGDGQDIGFCHNDLQYGNIMISDETRTVTLIDYEYASYNPIAYDIANHFCEMAANYHSNRPHLLDYNMYPGLEERWRFISWYLSSSGNNPSKSEVQQLVQETELYTLSNHLLWGIWGIISAYINKIDFDYMEYARQRFEQYWLRKPQLLGVQRATV
ncbi:hypothetical protein Droror1_Dr00016460 [Drosera rotundifolia]